MSTNKRFRMGVLLIFCLTVYFAPAAGGARTALAMRETRKGFLREGYGNLPLCFIKNDGQASFPAEYYESGGGHATFFAPDGVYFRLPVFNAGPGAKALSRDIKLSFVGAAPAPEISAAGRMSTRINYLMGSDPVRWKKGLPTFREVVYRGLYPGIDVKFYGNNRQLEYDFIVAPGADPAVIKLSYEGVEGLKVNDKGDLVIMIPGGSLLQKKPYVYQEREGRRVELKGAFRLEGGRGAEGTFFYSFALSDYDKSRPLIIDPVFVYSTYLGGGSYDHAYDIAVDGSGCAYITGETNSSDFITVNSLFGKRRRVDAFVLKLNAAGDALEYATYLGGDKYDRAYGVAVDGSGCAYLTGVTASDDFPVVNPLFAKKWGSDAFVVKLNAAGDALLYSTFLGGALNDLGWGVAVDSAGCAHVVGYTYSYDFPLQNQIVGYSGMYDAFVSKLNAAGDALVYSTCLGGSNADMAYDIALDRGGYAYVTGCTNSSDFPLQNPLYNNLSSWDAFVAGIEPDGGALVYSTYLGGTSFDYAYSIDVDGRGFVYVAGETSSADFPTVNPVLGDQGGKDAFVSKLNAAGDALVYSTYLGGSDYDRAYGVAADEAGYAYVTGNTSSADFPLKSALMGDQGGWDVFLTKIAPAGNDYVYSTYLGGSRWEYGYGVAADGGGVYIAGSTSSDDFTARNPFSGSNSGNFDAFAAKFIDTLYVDDDAPCPGDGRYATPFCSIQRAIEAAADGVIVVVEDGNYSERIDFLGKALRVRSRNGSARAVIDGGAGGTVAVFSSGEGAGSVLEGFSLTNGAAAAGAGVYCNASSPTLIDCAISGNQGGSGGGVRCENGAEPLFVNCLISGNAAENGAGASLASAARFYNCTFSGNRAGFYGGAVLSEAVGSIPEVVNTVLWGDRAGLAGDEVYLESGGLIGIEYSDVEGGWLGEGNLESDPYFMAPLPASAAPTAGGDYRIDMASPCIDAADSDPPAPDKDMEGKARYDDPGTANSGRGAYGDYYDIGAYENQEVTLPNSDPAVDVYTPGGGEAWAGWQTIAWLAEDPEQNQLYADLYYGYASENSWTVIAQDVPCASGVEARYSWYASEAPIGDYWVKVVVRDSARGVGEGTSGGFFTIYDGVAPAGVTSLVSTSHPGAVGQWHNPQSRNNVVSLAWSAALDEPGGSGLDGYSVVWDDFPATVPDTVKDIEEDVTGAVSSPLPDGTARYFHIRAVDNAGNWQDGAAHIGPFYIDTVHAVTPLTQFERPD